MKYVFNNDTKTNEYPISAFHVCCYDDKGEIIDECWANPQEADPECIIVEGAVENENTTNKIFAHHKDGSIYELIFRKIIE